MKYTCANCQTLCLVVVGEQTGKRGMLARSKEGGPPLRVWQRVRLVDGGTWGYGRGPGNSRLGALAKKK